MALQLVVDKLRGAMVGPVSFTVAAGGCAAIAGDSGAGKSLLLRMIADLDPNDGEISLGDLHRGAIPAPVWRRQVVHVAAEPGWWAETVAAHVPATMHGAAVALAEQLGLSGDVLGRAVRTFSTGERQRLALVRALVRGPRALLLDEPTSALEAGRIESVEGLLRERLAAGLVLVLVTHDPHQAQRLGATPYRMSAGRLTPA